MVEVSIIIPSRNRYPLNLLTLFSLEKQTFDLSKMEVILIDDGSADDTPLLKHYHPPFPFRYVRNEKNIGLSATRNKGLMMAKANIIIFLDAEMIVDPSYVKNQYQYHLTEEQLVVVGRNIPRIITYLFPEFNSSQIDIICRMAEEKPAVKQLISQKLPQYKNSFDLPNLIKNLQEPLQLLNQSDINNSPLVQSFSYPYNYYEDLYRQLEVLDTQYLSWWALFGSNHSLNKKLIEMVGGYEEGFKGWGIEDVEFAYRLYKAGAKFVFDPDSFLYHQEHPIHSGKVQEGSRNRVLFQRKHPVIEVCIRSLRYVGKLDLQFVDSVLREHELLCNSFPGLFADFKNTVVLLLQQIQFLKLQEQPVCNFLKNAGIENDTRLKQAIYQERDIIAAYGKFGSLVQLFDLLANN
ncbi:hypothetical protein CVD28_11100 [Bacillus sp. M6-12]|uniref:glycosyltransferase family 2 protein n=1 Tax=Bacillus sp. M6-12 TaxID=2054166 RepID=UPI000C78C520|nr:glycosyltransferase family 2 protein [Bacillus sp. M6-12]PLS17539.1 hypothetical protein CVD28_11100 [Bacillus sp. M6-12]